MTKPYDITAWCDRPFFAYFTVEADSPEQALEIGKRRVHDEPAEDCDASSNWNWDRFRVEDDKGDNVLEHEAEHVRQALAAQHMYIALKAISDDAMYHDADRDDDMALVPVEYIHMARAAVKVAERGDETVATEKASPA